MNFADSQASSLLSSFAVEIIKRVSAKTKIDPDVLAATIPGLVHDHWYISDEPVEGCLYCARAGSCGGGKPRG